MSKRPSKKRSHKKSRLFLWIVGIFVCAAVLWYVNPTLFAEAINTVSENLGLPVYVEVPQAEPPASSGSHFSSVQSLPVALEIPLCEGTDGDDDFGAAAHDLHQIRKFAGYTICYRENYEQPEWAAYTLTPEKLTKHTSRGDNFRPDPEISTGSAELSDYRGSGYDRGHLAPAADMAYSEEAMSDSFYLSNMSPQVGSFNRGIWSKAEAYVRSTAGKYDTTYVVTGPILNKPADEYGSIGVNEIRIPEYYYKVALFVKGTGSETQKIDTWAVLIPNAKLSDPLESFLVSIDQIEELTGLDLFYLLDDEIETMLESSINASVQSPAE